MSHQEEKEFIGDCERLGLSSEQIFELLKLKLQSKLKMDQHEELKLQHEQLKLEIELCKLKSGIHDETNENKRKFDQVADGDESEFRKIRKHVEIFCDDILLQIFEYLNINFDLFKYLRVSKQFRKVVYNSKRLTLNTNLVPRYNLDHIEKLNIDGKYDKTPLSELILKCTNIKRLHIKALDCKDEEEFYLKFKKPTIESITINHCSQKLMLRGPNFYNLKYLNVGFDFEISKLSNFINPSTDCLIYLKFMSRTENLIDHSPLFNLLFLKRLELYINNESEIVLILNNIKTLEVLKIENIEEDYINNLTIDTDNILNLKYLSINCNDYCISNTLKCNFSNLKILQLFDFGFDQRDADNGKILNNNKTVENVEVLIFIVSRYSYLKHPHHIELNNFKSLKHLFIELCNNIPITNNRLISNLESLYLSNCVCDFEQINFSNLKKLAIQMKQDELLLSLVKIISLRNLEFFGIDLRPKKQFPKLFFEELRNYEKLTQLACSFSSYKDIELLQQFKPPKLKQIVIYNSAMEVSSLITKSLEEWTEINWKVDSFYPCFEQITKFEHNFYLENHLFI